MSWHKFYICQFNNRIYDLINWPNHVLVKFGKTRHMDVMDRFNPDIDDGYPKIYTDWKIIPKFSLVCEDEAAASRIEDYYLNIKYPYNNKRYKVWVEKELGLTDMNYYRDNSGVSELRMLHRNEATELYQKLNARKKELLA